MKIYHQLGHNYTWNLDSHFSDRTGKGLIIAPRFMDKQLVEGYAKEFKNSCLFDPQFFKPHFPKNKLSTYDFFPEILAENFNTQEYLDKSAIEVARRCVKWQDDNNFEYIVIPNRYESATPSDFIRHQQEFFVGPFLEAIREQKIQRPVLLQLVANQHMFSDTPFRNELLNWITGLQGVAGVYLIAEIQGRNKQLKDIGTLRSILTFVDVLRGNSLEVFMGYTNTEALLLSIADVSAITLGSYETQRIFDIRNFEETKSTPKRPNARIYSSRLLHWIDANYVEVINEAYGGAGSFFDQTDYQVEMFKPTFQWHFQKPELYKHYFVVFSKQLSELSGLVGRDRWELVCKLIDDARKVSVDMDKRGIALDTESLPSHLGPWLTVANAYGKYKGWK